MASKHFLVNPTVDYSPKKTITKIHREKEKKEQLLYDNIRTKDKVAISEEDTLKFISGRVIVKIDIDSKDSWTFSNGMKIEYKRRFNNFNVRETMPVNAIVISAENIPKDAEILVHPNSIHDSNRIFDYKNNTGNIRYYSITTDTCFAWHDGNDWQPLKGFDLGLRIFKPYEGLISGIEPTLVKDCLWVTSGELKNKAVKTVVAADYTIVFQDKNGREGNLIRFRAFGNEKEHREPEAICVMNNLTEQVNSNKLLLGLSPSDCKHLNELVNG